MLWGGWGERNRERAGHDWKEKERREAPAFSLFPSFPARFLFFDYCYFYWDTLREHLRRRQLFCNKLGERQRARFPYSISAFSPPKFYIIIVFNISKDECNTSLPRRRFYGSSFFIPPHRRDEKRAPLKTPAWEANVTPKRT